MIATATNNLRGVTPTPFNLMPSVGALANFPPVSWENEPTQYEEFVQIEIPSSQISIPKQRFIFRYSPSEQHFLMESLPSENWPKIIIELEADAQEVYQCKRFKVSSASRTTDAEIKYTRFELSLAESKSCTFDIGLDAPLRANFAGKVMADDNLNHLRQSARIFRKLGFLEKVFHHKFNVPSEIPWSTVAQIETLFRGITEGQFTTRLESALVMVDPATVDLQQPSWSRPGHIRHLVSEREGLLGTTLDTGPIWLEAFQAQIGSYTAIRQIEQGALHPIEALFGLLDHQVTFCFERYANRLPQEREAKLKQYLHELSLVEPSSIYNLTLESLISDVTEKEADILSMGWTHVNRLPDRYCPQTPVLDVSKKFWRVPLWITYPSGKGAAVADLFVDVKTGVVTSSLPVSEIRIRGKQLAQQLLYASETAVSSARN